MKCWAHSIAIIASIDLTTERLFSVLSNRNTLVPEIPRQWFKGLTGASASLVSVGEREKGSRIETEFRVKDVKVASPPVMSTRLWWWLKIEGESIRGEGAEVGRVSGGDLACCLACASRVPAWRNCVKLAARAIPNVIQALFRPTSGHSSGHGHSRCAGSNWRWLQWLRMTRKRLLSCYL